MGITIEMISFTATLINSRLQFADSSSDLVFASSIATAIGPRRTGNPANYDAIFVATSIGLSLGPIFVRQASTSGVPDEFSLNGNVAGSDPQILREKSKKYEIDAEIVQFLITLSSPLGPNGLVLSRTLNGNELKSVGDAKGPRVVPRLLLVTIIKHRLK